MSDSIVSTMSKLLQSVNIAPESVKFAEVHTCDAKIVFNVNWFFEVDCRDTPVRMLTQKDITVDEDALNEFQKTNVESLSKNTTIRKPFCTSLSNKSAREIFALGNKVNRIGARHAKGECRCPDCKGTRRVNCPNCSGYGSILCPSCQGREKGCSRCNHTGYVECPTCHKMQKIPCTKCRGEGHLVMDRMVSLLAKTFPLIEVHFHDENNLFKIPPVHVDFSCYQNLLSKLPFQLKDAEFKEEGGLYRMEYEAETQVEYVTFRLNGKLFSFYTCCDGLYPMNYPPVLEAVYTPLRNRLGSAALGQGSVDIETKMEIFKMLCDDPFFYSLLKSYEYNVDTISRTIHAEPLKNDVYTSRYFTMKDKLMNMLARRKEQLSDMLAKKILSSTNNLMRESFAKDLCLILVEFISNLKYRSSSGKHYWDLATSFVWILSFVINFFIPTGIIFFLCFLFSIVCGVLVSYFCTKSLRFYEVIKLSHTFDNISKFIDLNYDLTRFIVMQSGLFIMEFMILLVR